MTNEKQQRSAELAKNSVMITHGEKLEIILGEGNEVDAMVRKALLQGKEVRYKADGRKEQIHDRLVFDSSKDFVWNKSGNRCKHTRTMVTIHKDGTLTEEVLKTVWKSI